MPHPIFFFLSSLFFNRGVESLLSCGIRISIMCAGLTSWYLHSVSTYLSSTNVQLGASYPIAQASTNLVAVGEAAVAKYVNAQPDELGE